jgi:hypothetical protein
MNKEEFLQLHATDQVSCNGVTGLVVGVGHDGVRIQFDGDKGAAVLSAKDSATVNTLCLVRKGTKTQFSEPTAQVLYPRGYHTRTDQS